LRFAVIRVVLTLLLGYTFALPLPRLLGIDQHWGAAGLTLSAGIAGWVEFVLLRRALHGRIGLVPYQVSRVARLWLAALAAAGVGYALKRALPIYLPVMRGPHSPLLVGPCVLIVFGAVYLLLVHLLGIAMPGTLSRLLRRRG
jgi:putative peptidoglycan lipid II flippase